MWSGFRSALAGLVSVCCVTGASAADLYTKAPIYSKTPIAYQKNWTGWYVGAGGGYSWGDVTLGTVANPNASNLNPSGGFFVVQGGYDYQFANNVVLGARVIVPVLSVRDETFSPIAGSLISGKAKSAVMLAGRLGYAMGNYLPYVIGGYVWARGEAENAGCCSVTARHTGGLIGLGLETAIYQNWTLDVNWSYVDMSKSDYNFTPFGGAVVTYGFKAHNLTAAVNYRF
jgi:outer membrane immunogenic protein